MDFDRNETKEEQSHQQTIVLKLFLNVKNDPVWSVTVVKNLLLK